MENRLDEKYIGVYEKEKNEVSEELENWFQQIKDYKRLSFIEAKEQYEFALTIKNEEEKNILINNIILQTLYVIYEYLKNNNIKMFESSSCDIDDIISSLSEQWTIRIRNGALFNVDYLSGILYSNLISISIKNTIFENSLLNNMYSFNKEKFIEYFDKYIELKNENEDISFITFLTYVGLDDYYGKYSDNSYDISLMFDTFENLYNSLINENDVELKLGITNIRTYYCLLVDMGIFDRINDNIQTDYNMEDVIVEKELLQKFIETILNLEMSDIDIDILCKRFGIDGKHRETLKTLAKTYNITAPGIRQKEAVILKKIRENSDINVMKNDLVG